MEPNGTKRGTKRKCCKYCMKRIVSPSGTKWNQARNQAKVHHLPRKMRFALSALTSYYKTKRKTVWHRTYDVTGQRICFTDSIIMGAQRWRRKNAIARTSYMRENRVQKISNLGGLQLRPPLYSGGRNPLTSHFQEGSANQIFSWEHSRTIGDALSARTVGIWGTNNCRALLLSTTVQINCCFFLLLAAWPNKK